MIFLSEVVQSRRILDVYSLDYETAQLSGLEDFGADELFWSSMRRKGERCNVDVQFESDVSAILSYRCAPAGCEFLLLAESSLSGVAKLPQPWPNSSSRSCVDMRKSFQGD